MIQGIYSKIFGCEPDMEQIKKIPKDFYSPCVVAQQFISFFEKYGGKIEGQEEEINKIMNNFANGKIETNQRQPTREMIPILAKVFNISVKELNVKFLSEKILYEIQNEEHGLDALKVAEQSFTYSKTKKN
jgi:hypothetical protein